MLLFFSFWESNCTNDVLSLLLRIFTKMREGDIRMWGKKRHFRRLSEQRGFSKTASGEMKEDLRTGFLYSPVGSYPDI